MEISSSTEEMLGDENILSAEELENFYVMLENGNIPQLSWKCLGRRPPSVERTNKVEHHVKVESIENHEPVKNDFDFSDDISSQPQMRVRGQNTTPKSAKKKTANFAGVMEQLKKKNAEG